METKYEMPSLTDEQREELIAEIDYNRKNCFLSSKTEILMQIAQAALMTPPVASVVVHQDVELNWQGRELKFGDELYAAPPVPALKLPDEIKLHGDMDEVAVYHWNAAIAEVKKLNGVTE